MGYRAECYTVCPFYQRETATGIICDSTYKFAKSQQAQFETKQLKEKYQQRCCFSYKYAEECETARMLMKLKG